MKIRMVLLDGGKVASPTEEEIGLVAVLVLAGGIEIPDIGYYDKNMRNTVLYATETEPERWCILEEE